MGELEGNDPQPICGLPEEIEKAPENAGALVHLRGLEPASNTQQISGANRTAVAKWHNLGTPDSKLNQLVRIWNHLSESNCDQLLRIAKTFDK